MKLKPTSEELELLAESLGPAIVPEANPGVPPPPIVVSLPYSEPINNMVVNPPIVEEPIVIEEPLPEMPPVTEPLVLRPPIIQQPIIIEETPVSQPLPAGQPLPTSQPSYPSQSIGWPNPINMGSGILTFVSASLPTGYLEASSLSQCYSINMVNSFTYNYEVGVAYTATRIITIENKTRANGLLIRFNVPRFLRLTMPNDATLAIFAVVVQPGTIMSLILSLNEQEALNIVARRVYDYSEPLLATISLTDVNDTVYAKAGGAA